MQDGLQTTRCKRRLRARHDTVKTRLGDLKFEQGYPTEETKRKVFDEIDYQRCRAGIPVGLSGGARAVD